MKIISNCIIPIFLCLLVAVTADDTNTSTSSSTGRDLRKVKGKPIGQPVSKKDRKPKQKPSLPKGKQFDRHPQYEVGMERMLSETRTTLLNVDLSSLTADEYLFFEDTLREAIESVYDVTVKSAIVQRAEKPSGDPKRRNLRGDSASAHGGRALDEYFYEPINWFDILALLEIYTCRYCGAADDDDDPYFDDDYNFGFRKLGDEQVDDDLVAKKTLLETTLCVGLRESSFEKFQDAQGCQVLISA